MTHASRPIARTVRTLLRGICLLAALTALPATASDDFGIWTGIGAEKKFNKKFSVEAGLGFRAEQQLKSAARWDASVGVGYKPWRFLKLSAGYVYLYDRSLQEAKVNYGNKSGRKNGYNVDHGYWRSKHRAYFDVTGKVDAGRFTFSLRERYQMTHSMAATCVRDRYRDLAPGGYNKEVYTWNGENFMSYERTTDDKGHKNAHYLRSRFQVEYNIRHCPVDPFVSYELSNNLSDALTLDKTRLTVGADWAITKQHKLSLAYIYQNGADDDGNDDIHVIDIGYKFSF